MLPTRFPSCSSSSSTWRSSSDVPSGGSNHSSPENGSSSFSTVFGRDNRHIDSPTTNSNNSRLSSTSIQPSIYTESSYFASIDERSNPSSPSFERRNYLPQVNERMKPVLKIPNGTLPNYLSPPSA